MKRIVLWACLVTSLASVAAFAQESPRSEPSREGAANLLEPRAILEIKSEAGTCYWRIAGDDDLVRLPVQDDRFSSILLSARFDQDQLHLTLAGERSPLDTSTLGQFDLGFKDSSPVTVSSFRAVKSKMDGSAAGTGGWEVRALSPITKVDTSNGCSCGIAKLSCSPNKNYCMGCGVCGNCCG